MSVYPMYAWCFWAWEKALTFLEPELQTAVGWQWALGINPSHLEEKPELLNHAASFFLHHRWKNPYSVTQWAPYRSHFLYPFFWCECVFSYRVFCNPGWQWMRVIKPGASSTEKCSTSGLYPQLKESSDSLSDVCRKCKVSPRSRRELRCRCLLKPQSPSKPSRHLPLRRQISHRKSWARKTLSGGQEPRSGKGFFLLLSTD